MSLNGLEAPDLQLAYENAGTEPGKWFLIKYISRDEVELLAQGANGAPEMREHLANEPDDAPLFGYIRFRRKNVLVKYIPEAASRVIKARCQVHFQLVSERFALHDKQFNISTARELTDSALAAACSNHSSTASVSSSTSSLPNRRLEDIAESTEEVEESEEDVDPDHKRRNLTPAPHCGKRPRSPLATEVVLSETDEDYEHSIHQTITSNSLSPPTRESFELRRKSTSNTKPEGLTEEQLVDLAAEKLLDELYPLKQKVRLGPRPSLDASRRPNTAGSGRSSKGDFKPVAALPRSLQGKKSSKEKRSKGDEEPKIEDFAIVNATPLSEQNLPSITGTLSITDPYLPPKTSGSTTSLTPSLSIIPPVSTPAPSEPGVLSPEKQKLMRALQLRRRTMAPPSIDIQAAPVAEKAVENVVIEESHKVAEEVVEDVDVVEGVVEEKQSEPFVIKEVDSADEKPEEPNKEETGKPVREPVDKPTDSDVDEGVVKDTTVENIHKEVEAEAFVRSKPIDIVTIEKPEGTKVRGSESDYESDSEESEAAVEIAVAEHHPITPLRDVFAPSSPDSSLSSTPKSPVVRTINIPAQENKQMKPLAVQKRGDRETDSQRSDSPPPIPPARSVSAPFVSTATAARRSSAVPVMARKVNVSNGAGGGGGGGSSVLQRIRQLEQIANSKAPSPAAVPSGLTSQARSVTPTFPMKAAGLKPSSGFASPHPASLIDRSETRTAPPRHDWPRRTSEMPSLSKPPSQDFKPRFTGTSLQVTTRIVRDMERPATSADAISTSASDRRASVDMSMLNTSFAGPSQPTPRSPATPVIKKSESRSFFKSSTPKSPSIDSKGTSPTSPAESKKSFFKDKDEKKKSKAPSTHEEKKSPVLPLLRRMSSSLSWRSKEKEPSESLSVPAPVEIPEPPSPKQKSYLLAGWVNVQLPDTLLWRRRCMKVDSDGWLYLSVTEDETTPQTRRYHISSEVRQAKVPDLDEQELPFSVQLFLSEGGMLQAACQNSREQKEILGVMQSCLA